MTQEELVFQKIQEYFSTYDSAFIQKQSFDFFIHHRLNKIIEEEPVIEVALSENKFYRVKFGQVFVDKPYIIDDDRQVRFITPNEARLRDLTYSSVVSVNIRTCMVDNGEEYEEKEFFKVLIARIPMMVGSSKCNLSEMTPDQRKQVGECSFDRGGYFIVKGKERVLVSQERMNHNIVYVFDQRPSNKFLLVAEIRSMSEETGHSVLVQMKLTQDKKVVIQIPYISQEIPLGIVLRGYDLSVQEIERILLFNLGGDILEKHPELFKTVRGILRDAEMMDSHDRVLSYISQFAVHNVSKERKLFYVNQILTNELFPHLGITSCGLQKVSFLAHMCSKLIRTFVKQRPMDDRDHINNKRIEVSGHLLSDLFRTLFKRFVRTIEPQLQKRPDVMIVISRVNLITQGIKHCFSTGNWGMPKSSYIRTGVSQIMSRLTYNSYLSHLARILIPIGKEGKNTKIRQVHPSQIGFICPHETPEGHCLTGETRILLEDGVSTLTMNQLENVDVDTNITSVNVNNGNVVKSGFYNFFKIQPESLYRVCLMNGATIKASGLHPFLVYREDGPVWIQTQDLLPTDRIAYTFPVRSLEWESMDPANKTLQMVPERLRKKLPRFLLDRYYKSEVFLRQFSKTRLSLIAARVFGILCLGLDHWMSGSSIPIPKHVDAGAFFRDVKKMLPPDSCVSVHHHQLHLGQFEWWYLSMLLEIPEWIQKKQVPSWIQEGNLCVQREFCSGFFASHRYGFIDPKQDSVQSLTVYVQTQEWDIWKCFFQTMWKMLCGIQKGGWDLQLDPTQGWVSLRPALETISETIDMFGIRYQPHFEKQIRLSQLFYQYSDRWTTWQECNHLVNPCGKKSTLLYLPLDSVVPIPKEITMDFTTTSEHHSFIANGFVTHNSAGIVKNISVGVQVTTRVDTTYLRMILEGIPNVVLMDTSFWELMKHSKGLMYKIFLNGIWVGVCEGQSTYELLCQYKHQNRFPSTVSISLSHSEKEIHVYGDEGRMVRPVWDTKYPFHEQEWKKKTVSTLIKEKKIVLLDSYEIENKVIAMSWEEMRQNKFYDYCEIHPSLLSGLCVSIIPYAEHTQAPRITYHASMGKQAIGYYATTHSIRTDTISHLLWYPERPIVRTHYGQFTGCDEMASGNNLIVAICTYTGFNQEDSVIFNQSAIDRGLFRSFSFRTLTIEERKKSTSYTETIRLPGEEIRTKSFNYSKLNPDGLVKVGVFVGSGDVIVGRVQTKNVKSNMDEHVDTSVIIKTGEEGYVDTVVVTQNPDGYKIIKVKIRTLKIPEIGDKVASRSAQKGTIGMVFRQEDMPFTLSGIVPDILINPLCIPSRMTINQLIECLGAKSGAHKSIYRYSTAFSTHSQNIMETLCEELHDIGFERNGNETMMNGFSGEMFDCAIFIGPTYYHRLKHLVSAKIHARNHGSLQALTRQPLEGRSRDGGLRFGEMERDCMISHGVSRFLTERLFDMSDKFSVPVCAHCGIIPNVLDHCNSCHLSNIRRTPLPYACKLLFQELMAMGIKINLFPTEDI